MKIRHSDSLILIWRLAELEARQLMASNIEPTHLLLGLCKSVDLDLPTLVQKDSPDRDEVLEELLREVRRLRTIFRAAGLDARTFCRALRSKSAANRMAPPESRSLEGYFVAKLRNKCSPTPSTLRRSRTPWFFRSNCYSLYYLPDDQVRDDLLEHLGVDPERLRKVAKREIAFSWAGRKPSAGLNRDATMQRIWRDPNETRTNQTG